MTRHQVEQLMAAYAKDFSRFPLGEPMFSQEFHDERFFYFRFYFLFSKFSKKLVGQLDIKMYSFCYAPYSFRPYSMETRD
jgi:outer membrane protein assembly factor BamE (lipoprotein component of BamABCDE complex)